jgi:hypothetical protein
VDLQPSVDPVLPLGWSYTSNCRCPRSALIPRFFQNTEFEPTCQNTDRTATSVPEIRFVWHDDYYYYLVCEAIGTAATPGLLCQPRVIMKMIVEKQIRMKIDRGNRRSRRKPAPAPLLSITKSHITRPVFEPWPPR